MPQSITPAILNAADQVEHDLGNLDVSTRALLTLLRAGETGGGGGGGGGDAYRYFRLNITDNNGANNINIAELEVRTSVSGATVTTGGTPSASQNDFPATNGPDKAFDQNGATAWATSAGTTTGWLQYDLGDGNDVTAAEYAVQAAAGATRAPRDWTFEGSSDGSAWTVLDTQADQGFSASQSKAYAL